MAGQKKIGGEKRAWERKREKGKKEPKNCVMKSVFS
jgi:hypothetical protein